MKYKKRLVSISVLSLIVYASMCLYGDLRSIADLLKGFKWSLLPIVLLLSLVNYGIRFVKWDYYLRISQIKVLWYESFIVFMSGLMMAITPAKIGELLKPYLLKEKGNIPLSTTIPVVFAERVTDLIAFIILSSLGTLIFETGRKILLICLLLILAALVLLSWKRGGLWVIKQCNSVRILESHVGKIRSMYLNTRCLLAPFSLVFAVCLSILSWSCECLGLYIIFKALGIPLSIGHAFFAFSFATLVGVISLLPGGLGSAEGSMTAFLVMRGATASSAVTATLLIRLCSLWFGVMLGGLFFLLCRKTLFPGPISDLTFVEERNQHE